MTADNRKGHGARTDATKERVILALVAGQTIKGAAAAAGVAEKTVRLWLQANEFKTRLDEARGIVFAEGVERVRSLASQAVDALAYLMRENTPPSVRLAAARTILELGFQRHEAEQLRQRIADLEKRLEEGVRGA